MKYFEAWKWGISPFDKHSICLYFTHNLTTAKMLWVKEHNEHFGCDTLEEALDYLGAGEATFEDVCQHKHRGK